MPSAQVGVPRDSEGADWLSAQPNSNQYQLQQSRYSGNTKEPKQKESTPATAPKLPVLNPETING